MMAVKARAKKIASEFKRQHCRRSVMDAVDLREVDSIPDRVDAEMDLAMEIG